MTWIAPEVTRVEEPSVGDEVTLLNGWLDWQRQTLLFKCQGLTAEQLKLAAAEPSNLTLLGLVRHMSDVERWWFRAFRGESGAQARYSDDTNEDGDFDDVAEADAEAAFAAFAEDVEAARAAVAGVNLDETYPGRRRPEISLRWIFLHMIEEYARHNGHADLIRQSIDGQTGE